MRSADADLWRHAASVAQVVRAIVSLLPKLRESERASIVDAAWLHDIGKLTIPGEVMSRPGPLSQAEWVEMRAHPSRGADYLERSVVLRQAARLVGQHHEWHDRRGYPNGLGGSEIELGARIIGVADAFDAMTSWRPYRETMSQAAATLELLRCAGTQFDPEIVNLFVRATTERVTESGQ